MKNYSANHVDFFWVCIYLFYILVEEIGRKNRKSIIYKTWTRGKVDELVVKQVVVKSNFELDFKSLLSSALNFQLVGPFISTMGQWVNKLFKVHHLLTFVRSQKVFDSIIFLNLKWYCDILKLKIGHHKPSPCLIFIVLAFSCSVHVIQCRKKK